MKRNYAKRITAGILSAVLAVGMAGCGKTAASDGSSTNESTPAGSKDGYVYQAEWLSTDDSEEGSSYSCISVKDDVLYFVRNIYTDNGAKREFCKIDLNGADAKTETLLTLSEYSYGADATADGVETSDGTEDSQPAEDAAADTAAEDVEEAAGTEEQTLDGTSGTADTVEDVSVAVALDKDTLVTVSSIAPNIQPDFEDPNFDYDKYYKEVQDNTVTTMKKMSMDGTVIKEEDVTEVLEGQYMQYALSDASGNLYLSSGDGTIFVFDSELNLTDTVKVESNNDYSSMNAMGVTEDGRIAILKYTDSDMGLCMYDAEKKAFGEPMEGLPSNMWNSSISFTEDGSVLLNNSEGAYLYDMESRTATQIVKWMDCDLTPDYVRNIYAMSDGNFVVFYEDWNTNESDIIVLKKVAAADVVQKQVVTVGVLYSSQKLQADIVEFNKNSDKYRVELKDYTSNIEYTTEDDYQKNYQNAVTQMNNDIVSGKLDMFAADSVDIENLISKGAVEDLNSYLETSTQVKKSDLMENIINAIEESGVLYCVPTSFSINTLVGRTEDVGEKSGWTMADVKALCDKYPDASLFANATRGTVLNALLSYDFDSYVDWENGVCHFDQEEFKQLLEMVAKYPSDDEFDWEKDYVAEPKAFRNHTALLGTMYISEVTDYQVEEKLFDAPITAIGYPTDGSRSGVAASISGGVCINTASKNKDACWEFIEYTLVNNKIDSIFMNGFPVRKADFDALIEKKLAEKDSSYGYSWDDVEITVEGTTQEDVDKLKDLISRVDGISVNQQDSNLMNIITEEAEAYFTGQKSLDDVTSIIQSRATIYVNENK